LSKTEEVARYLQHEWESSTSGVGERKDDDTASVIVDVEKLTEKSNQQTCDETDNIGSHHVGNSSVSESVSGLEFEPFLSCESSPDNLQSSNALCFKTCTTPAQTIGTVADKPAVMGNETNGSLSLQESNHLAESSYCETDAGNRCDLKSSVQINDGKNNMHTDLPDKSLSSNPTMQNFVSQEGMPIKADTEKLPTNDGLNPQDVDIDALQQAMMKQGVSLDLVLFEAVKAQIAQVYPAFAMDPNTLNSIALQQTMVLQACVATGGTTGTAPIADGNQLRAAFQQDKAKSYEGLIEDQTNESTSCVQAAQPKPSPEGTSGFSQQSAEGITTQIHTSYQKSGFTANPLPFKAGLPAGVTKIPLQSEMGKQCEFSPDVTAPPGLAGHGEESLPSSTVKPYFQDPMLGKHTLASPLQHEKVDQNKNNRITEIPHNSFNQYQSSNLARFVDSQSKPTLTPELTVNSNNLDEIDDDDDMEEDEQFELHSKSSREVFNQWQKPLIKERAIPAPENKPDQQGIQKLGSVMTTKITQMGQGSLQYQMKKDTKGKRDS
jgi:hypothetical protein